MARTASDLAGRTVMVTGAARGVGAATARAVAARGARVALVGLEPERLDALAAELPDAVWFEADVTSWDDLQAAADGTVERLGGIDVVVANAGIARSGTVQDMPIEDFERIVEVNLLGVWRTIRTTLPHVVERRGYVIPIASIYTALHGPLSAPYAVAKAGVEALANVLRVEVAGQGVGVGVAYFSYLDTDLVRDVFADPEVAEIRRRAGWPLNVTSPVEPAVEALVRGIERRARTVAYPRWVHGLLAGRGLAQPLAEATRMKRIAAEVGRRRAQESPAPLKRA
jgi:NAD(P)-dependent dehydrogenase (short-subunit alcohol dehydrogenase family)